MLKAKLFQAKQFVSYWLDATSEHSLQSPFLFDFYNNVVKEKTSLSTFKEIEQARKELLANKTLLKITELGAGSLSGFKNKRSIADIARYSLSRPKFSRFLFRVSQYIGANTILEFGTSLGINTLYLSASAPEGTVFTFEGCSSIASRANELFSKFKAPNINLVHGDINQTLKETLNQLKQIDLAYLDANHRYKPTIAYFEAILPFLHPNAVVVVDDIYWSPDMKKAWETLKDHPAVTISIDIYDAGLLFFKEGLTKENVILEF